jgi:hypothetical protein
MVLLYKVPAALMPTQYWRAPWYDHQGPGWVTRRIYSGWVGGKILTAHRYCDGREDRYRFFLGLILFRLVGPPL